MLEETPTIYAISREKYVRCLTYKSLVLDRRCTYAALQSVVTTH